MHTVYILYSAKLHKYYIGYTSGNVQERLKKHLSNHQGFTSRSKDWEIVFIEYHETKSIARKRELEIKRWKSIKKIEELIKQNS